MALPVAAIVSIVFGVWALLVLIIFALYQVLKSRGTCTCECAPCGKEGEGPCSDCCISLSESCDSDCCKPSSQSCLDSVCPKKKISCVDIILCQCCAEPGEQGCCLKLCPCCEDCACCTCDCCRDCDSIKCCCIEVRLVSKTDSIRESSSTEPVQPPLSSSPRNVISVRSARDLTPPQTPATARSISQLELLSSTNSYQKPKTVLTKKNRPPLTKASKSETEVTSEQDSARTKQKQMTKSKSVPLPPKLPLRSIGRQESVDESKIYVDKQRNKGSKSGELIEVPVVGGNQTSPVHSNLFQMQNSSYLMYSYPTSPTVGLLDSSYGSSNLSGSFNSGLQSSRPLPVPSTYS